METWNKISRKRSYFKKLIMKLLDDPRKPGILNKKKHLSNYEIGDWTHGQLKVERGYTGNLKIGKFCSIGIGTIIILGGEHRIDWISTYLFSGYFSQFRPENINIINMIRTKGDVVIGNDVWIGEDCYILSGVTIGNGAVIGSRSVIRKNIPPYSIVVGNPARVAGYRFNSDIIEKMEKIEWWDWPVEKVIKAIPLLLSDSIEDFIKKYYVPVKE